MTKKFNKSFNYAKKAEIENGVSVNEDASVASTNYVKKERFNPQDKYPEHVVNLALIIKNNAEIRRFTSIGIINYLLQKGEIKGDKRYVSFNWNKFTVSCGGLKREYFYNETFFLNALVAAFTSFSASAQRTIDKFCKVELKRNIESTCNQEEIDNIVNMNECNQHDANVENTEEVEVNE